MKKIYSFLSIHQKIYFYSSASTYNSHNDRESHRNISSPFHRNISFIPREDKLLLIDLQTLPACFKNTTLVVRFVVGMEYRCLFLQIL